MIRVNVLCGGGSPEREVSLRSGKAVAAALRQADYNVTLLDPSDADIGRIANCEVVFPVLHGAGGEDGSIQTKLEARGTAYVGSGVAASQLCFDKSAYRQAMIKAGLPMARGTVIRHHEHAQHELARGMHVLKPITGGSSIDTFIVRDLASIPLDAIADAFTRYPEMLLEELVDGVELTVGVLGDTALPIIEIIPPAGGEFDYANKYNGATQEIVAPEQIDSTVQAAAQQLALQAHHLSGCRDFSRSDIICDTSGKLFLLETNTIPGMTDQSLYPKMAAAAGLSMTDLCSQLVELALSR